MRTANGNIWVSPGRPRVSEADRVTWLGVGGMGEAMAERLIAAGVEVHAWNRTGSRLDALIARGGQRLASSMLSTADIAFSMVLDDDGSYGFLTLPKPKARSYPTRQPNCGSLALRHPACGTHSPNSSTPTATPCNAPTPGAADGWTNYSTRTVRIPADVDEAHATLTLSHEFGHIRGDHENRFAGLYVTSGSCRGLAEVEAESIVYVVATVAGLAADASSVPYVAT